MVTVSEAKKHVGCTCSLSWRDRAGNIQTTVSSIYDVTFVPLYGACLATDEGDLHLDHIVEISPMSALDRPQAA